MGAREACRAWSVLMAHMLNENRSGDLAKATAHVLVAPGRYATLAVTCRTRDARAPSGHPQGPAHRESLDGLTAYALALARGLAQDGTPPTHLAVDAERFVDDVGGQARVSRLVLQVCGDVPGRLPGSFEATSRSPERLRLVLGDASPDVAVEVHARLVEGSEMPEVTMTPDRPATVHRPRKRPRGVVVLVAVAAVLVVLSGAALQYLARSGSGSAAVQNGTAATVRPGTDVPTPGPAVPSTGAPVSKSVNAEPPLATGGAPTVNSGPPSTPEELAKSASQPASAAPARRC